MVRSNRHKYVWHSRGECELFDLASDPAENVNRFKESSYHQAARHLHAELGKWLKATGDPWRESLPAEPPSIGSGTQGAGVST